MANYGLKYYAEWRNYRKHDYRLEVLRRGYSGSAKAMGDFAGCILEVQGSQGDIIAPIVKTQLRFTLIDTYDEPDTGSVKHGDWQEFYTPDAGLYKVVLKAWDSGAWVTEWSGYITPDSWAENLDYRTGVTITARDNIGHLQDFAFDMSPNSDGLVKISDLIDRAMEICELAMDYTIARSGLGPSSLNSIVADGVYLHDAYINASIFEDGNWYDALEKTLEAIGMALRYVGNNSVEITYLRNLPYMGNPYAQAGYQELEFYGGNLELDPAVKEIVEEQDYGHDSDVYFDVRSGLEFGSTETYRAKTDGNKMPSGGTFSRPEHDANINTVTDRGTSRWMVGSFLLDPSLYTPSTNLVRDEGQEGWKKYALVEANQISDSVQVAIFNMNTRTAAIKLVFQFTPTPLTLEYVGSTGASTNRIKNSGYSLSQIKYSVSRTGNGVKYWNGAAWVSTPQVLTQDYDAQNEYATDLEIQLKETEGSYPGQIIVIFYQITYKCWSDVGNGAYARVAAVRAELNATTAVSSNTVKTISNADYNVRITRRPLFGALSVNVGFVTPDNYKKGLYYYKDGVLTLYPYRVRFDGQASGREIPLPVLIHEQILCFYYGAARVLHGNCAPINKVRLEFQNRFRYKNTYYLLQGGSLDLFSGILTGAVLREYANFNDLWDGTTPTWSDDQGYNVAPSSGSGGGGSSSGGGGGGGGTVTSVGLSMPTGFSVQGSPVTGQGTFTVAYANGYSLPTTAKQGQWDNKQDAINDLEQIRIGARKGDTAYHKPRNGIPSTDLASGVIPDVSQFITRMVNDLVNYYTKSETYTKAEVAALIGAIQTFHYEIHASTSAVTSPSNNVLYLIGPTGSGADKYEEYVYDRTNQNPWVKIGDTSIDLSGLLPKTGGTLTGDLRLKPANANYGLRIRFGDGDYVYLLEDTDDHFVIYADRGIDLNTGSGYDVKVNGVALTPDDYVTKSTTQTITGEKTFTTKPVHIGSTSGIDVNGSSYIDIGEARLVYDSTNKALHITMKSGSSQTIGLYADGFVSAKGAAASGDQVKFVALTGAQTVAGVKTFSSNIIINGVTLTGSSSLLSVNKNASFSGITDKVGGSTVTHAVSIQDIINRIVALENA